MSGNMAGVYKLLRFIMSRVIQGYPQFPPSSLLSFSTCLSICCVPPLIPLRGIELTLLQGLLLELGKELDVSLNHISYNPMTKRIIIRTGKMRDEVKAVLKKLGF